MSWCKDAACLGTDVAMFFPERNAPTEPALAICARCPVRAECLAAADDDGIWGGTTAKERASIARRERQNAARTAQLRDAIANAGLGPES